MTLQETIDAHKRFDLTVALDGYKKLLAQNPVASSLNNNIGAVYRDLGQHDMSYCHLLIAKQYATKKNIDQINLNLAHTLQQMSKHDEAEKYLEEIFKKYIKDKDWKNPILQEAAIIHALILKKQGKLSQAETSLMRVLGANENNIAAWNNLGEVYWNMGLLDDSIEAYKKALALNPKLTTAHSNIILAMNYSDKISQEDIIQESRRFVAWHHPNIWYRHTTGSPVGLRVGFVSPYFCANPVGRFMVSIFKKHKKDQRTRFYCYSDTTNNDAITEIFKKHSNVWRTTVGLSNHAVAKMINEDKIDVLFDLSGYIGGNRLPVFMMKPAPVQVEYCGYFNTTQVPEMDYILVDDVCVPKDKEALYSERIVRMPDVYECYDPPDDAPVIGPLPELKNGYVTFICQQQLAKITDTTVRVWSEILNKVSDSRLIIRARGLSDENVCDKIRERFWNMGIHHDRLDLRGFCDSSEYYATYNEADIALAPIPFTGITTICDALWMGIPTVVLLGDSVGHRHAATALYTIGRHECICIDEHDYIQMAVEFAEDLSWLPHAWLRGNSRHILKKNPLCDADLFYKNFIDICWKMWRREI